MSSAMPHRRPHRSSTPPQRAAVKTIFDDTTRKILGLETAAPSKAEIEAIQKKYANLRRARREQLVGDIANAVLTLLGASETRSLTDPVVVDAREAAHLLGISVNALRLRTQRGQMPAHSIVRTGRRVQYKLEALRAMRLYTKRSSP